MNIIPELNLNKHPNVIKNNSIVHAENIKLSKDSAILENDEVYNRSNEISYLLDEIYGDERLIEYVLPCNRELILFTRGTTNDNILDIIRYDEIANKAKRVIDNFKYSGGKLLGTFTYNKNNLIIAISEYGEGLNIPLRTINLGQFNDDVNNITSFGIIPEVILPNLQTELVNGFFYKGECTFFIRYKINKYDYTQWYHIGLNTLVQEVKEHQVLKYKISNSTNTNIDNAKFAGFIDYFSDNKDICNKTVKCQLFDLDNNFKYYQIGVIIYNKVYTKAFKTKDVPINKKEIILSNSILESYASNLLLKEYYNLFNVKTLDTVNNRLYIGNFEDIKNNIDENVHKNIELKLSISKVKYETLYQSSNGYKNTFTKEGKKTIIGIYDIENAISFKEYSKTVNRLDKIGNALDTDKIKFTTITGISHTYELYQLYVVVGALYVKLNNGTQQLFTKNDTFAAIYINGKNIISNSLTLTFLYGYSVTSEEYKEADFNSHINNINNNINKRTLLGGEVYNFFIHYIDKYGQATSGYKIENFINTKVKLHDEYVDYIIDYSNPDDPIRINLNEIVPVDFLYGDTRYKVLVKAKSNINDEGSFIINRNGGYFVFTSSNAINHFDCDIEYNGFTSADNDSIKNAIYSKYKGVNEIWANIIEPIYRYELTNAVAEYKYNFLPFINSNEELLFRVPDISPIGTLDENIVFHYINLIANNITIPDGYNGWFISAEKLEKRRKITGFINLNYTKKEEYYNKEKNYIELYNDELNILDGINLKVDKIKYIPYKANKGVQLIGKHENITSNNYIFDKLYYGDYDDGVTPFSISYVDKINIVPADSINNYGKSTHLKLFVQDIPDIINKDLNQNLENDNIVYSGAYVELWDSSRDIYLDKNKLLNKITENYNDNITEDTILKGNFGFISFDTAIIADFRGVMFDEATKEYFAIQSPKAEYNDFINNVFLFFTFPNYSNYIKEFKSYKNNNSIHTFSPYYIPKTEEDEKTQYEDINILIPSNTIDLWKNDYNVTNNIKVYTGYNENIETVFNKTLRRSNIIQDESNVNAWREFEVEQYRNINENKGNIIKIVGIGKYFIVHTEHSMFLFNGTDTIKSNEGNIQLASVDIMNLSYQEVITSKLGYAGLQKEYHGIVGTFGYIFYSADDKRLYKYDNNQIITIDDSIIKELKNVTDIRFGDDKENNRLFVLLMYPNNTKLLSYNYNINKFISTHTETTFNPQNVGIKNWDMAQIYFYSTKSNVYLICNHQYTKTLDSNEEGNQVEKDINVSDILQPISNVYSKSSIAIIHNDKYELMKYLDNIIYKINKIDTTKNNIFYPVEGKDIHYAADSLQIYSEHCDTGIINIDTSKNLNSPDNYMTPYWRFGNWHFNAIRNKLTKKDLVADEKSRIFGNWFVVKFDFNTNQKVEIESLECKTSISEY